MLDIDTLKHIGLFLIDITNLDIMSLVLDRDPPVAVMSSKDRQPPSGSPTKVVSTGRLKADRQTLDEMYQPPSELFLKFVEDIETSKGSSNTKVEF